MSHLSHLSERSAVVVRTGPSSLDVRGLPGGEDDVSSYLPLHRRRSFLTVASIGRVPVALLSVTIRARILPCMNGKVLMVNPAANAEGVARLAARWGKMYVKSRDMPEGISLFLGFQDMCSARLSLWPLTERSADSLK